MNLLRLCWVSRTPRFPQQSPARAHAGAPSWSCPQVVRPPKTRRFSNDSCPRTTRWCLARSLSHFKRARKLTACCTPQCNPGETVLLKEYGIIFDSHCHTVAQSQPLSHSTFAQLSLAISDNENANGSHMSPGSFITSCPCRPGLRPRGGYLLFCMTPSPHCHTCGNF